GGRPWLWDAEEARCDRARYRTYPERRHCRRCHEDAAVSRELRRRSVRIAPRRARGRPHGPHGRGLADLQARRARALSLPPRDDAVRHLARPHASPRRLPGDVQLLGPEHVRWRLLWLLPFREVQNREAAADV